MGANPYYLSAESRAFLMAESARRRAELAKRRETRRQIEQHFNALRRVGFGRHAAFEVAALRVAMDGQQ